MHPRRPCDSRHFQSNIALRSILCPRPYKTYTMSTAKWKKRTDGLFSIFYLSSCSFHFVLSLPSPSNSMITKRSNVVMSFSSVKKRDESAEALPDDCAAECTSLCDTLEEGQDCIDECLTFCPEDTASPGAGSPDAGGDPDAGNAPAVTTSADDGTAAAGQDATP